jgi:hypothetical protein
MSHLIPRCFNPILSNIENGGTPTEQLKELFKLHGLPDNISVTEMAQMAAQWRTGRFQFQIEPKPGDQLEAARPLLRQLGMIEARSLSTEDIEAIRVTHSENVLLLAGGRFKAISKRMAFAFKALGHTGIDLDSFVTLGSTRRLGEDELEEVVSSGMNYFNQEVSFPLIEAELARHLFYKYQNQSGVLRQFLPVCAPPRVMPKELPLEELKKWRYDAGFDDTVDAWMEARKRMHDPVIKCNVIVVTSGPVWDRYARIVQQKMPTGSAVYCIGYETPGTLNLQQYLNELSMLLYECAQWLGE